MIIYTAVKYAGTKDSPHTAANINYTKHDSSFLSCSDVRILFPVSCLYYTPIIPIVEFCSDFIRALFCSSDKSDKQRVRPVRAALEFRVILYADKEVPLCQLDGLNQFSVRGNAA